jgi:hypothetical protein
MKIVATFWKRRRKMKKQNFKEEKVTTMKEAFDKFIKELKMKYFKDKGEKI